MDMSFANQALAAEYLYQHADELENKVYDVPAAIDDGVARVKLETLGVEDRHPHRGADRLHEQLELLRAERQIAQVGGAPVRGAPSRRRGPLAGLARLQGHKAVGRIVAGHRGNAMVEHAPPIGGHLVLLAQGRGG